MSKAISEGDLVTVTVTGKVERITKSCVEIYVHGVILPVLASQISIEGGETMTGIDPARQVFYNKLQGPMHVDDMIRVEKSAKELAQTILEAIERQGHEVDKVNFYTTADVKALIDLVDDIKELCQREIEARP